MSQDIDTSNYIWLAMTMHSWASDKDSERNAIGNLRGYAGSSTMKEYGYVTYRVHPDTEVSEIDGSFRHPIGHPPIKVSDRIKRRKKGPRASEGRINARHEPSA